MRFKSQENNILWESYSGFNDENNEENGINPVPSWVNDFDDGDLAAGAYWWAVENHGGQSSDGYKALSILGRFYKPSRLARGPEEGSGEEMVYDRIDSEEDALAIAMHLQNDLSNDEDENTAIISLEPIGPVSPYKSCNCDDSCDCHKMDDSSDQCDEVIFSDIKKLAEYSKKLLEYCNNHSLEPWMQAKVIKASDYISDIWHRLDASADFANDQHPDVKI
jgi:hypothetical protein